MKKNGFSLVEILVVIGLMGAVSLVTLKMVETQQGAVKYTEVRLNEIELYRQIQLNLSMRSSCKETFVTRGPVGGVLVTAAGVNVNAIYQSPPTPIPAGYVGKKIVEAGKEYEGFKVSQLRLTSEDPSTFGSLGNATLEIYTERLFKGVPKTQKKKMGINVVTSAAGLIEDCYVDEDALMKSMCESLDGTWDDTLTPPKCIQPNNMMEQMCLKMGGTWAIPTPPDPLNPTEKKCLGLVKGGLCPDGQVLVGHEVNGEKLCKTPFFHSDHMEPNIGPATRTLPIPGGKWKLCSLVMTTWNPANDGAPNTKFRCNLSHDGAGTWSLQLDRRNDRKDAVRCGVICF
jgi:prepilin-type N-terminal cleavage/methylation domain-containing protein